MWALHNRTRFVAERTFARDRDGAEVLLVVVKATFTISHDHAPRVAPRQASIAHTPRYRADPARSSLLHEADFALEKRRTDVLLVGNAHARDGIPTIATEVRVRVGKWQKRVAVFGDRRWTRVLGGLRLGKPEPFTSMPLSYERAFGGAGHRENPVGVGAERLAGALESTPVPNLEDRQDPLTLPEQDKRAMSFGPIARDWPARRALAGTFDERWRRERCPLVPDDFDDAFWQCAPPDQQISIEGGENVELTGVSPRGPMRFELPRLRFSFRSRVGNKLVEHPSSMHTLLFEPDENCMTFVFQSALPCHHELQSLSQTIVEEVDGQRFEAA
ncbi:MAG: DUF2169 domain-containing protein [Polyangiaceae bacterium]|nr:DUF2169 domain-containing protein [Polyangiaceae bacterium]